MKRFGRTIRSFHWLVFSGLLIICSSAPVWAESSSEPPAKDALARITTEQTDALVDIISTQVLDRADAISSAPVVIQSGTARYQYLKLVAPFVE